MNLKRQLLLVSLLTLVLPWAGCEFIRETETALREGQQQMLAGTARAIADSLSQFPDEFLAFQANGGPGAEQLYAHPLEREPLLDGYFDDWTLDRESLETLRGADGPIRYALGTVRRQLWLYVDVRDAAVLHSRPGEERDADRILLVSRGDDGAEIRYVFAPEAPGQVVATNAAGELEPRIAAHWQDVPGGYRLEARVPMSLVGRTLGLAVVNAAPGRRPVASRTFSGREPGVYVTPSIFLTSVLRNYAQPGLRLVVTDPDGWQLGITGDVSGGGRSSFADHGLLRYAYDLVLEPGEAARLAEPDPSGRERQPYVATALDGDAASSWFRSPQTGRAVVAVAQPVWAGTVQVGTVILQQGTDAILSLTSEALTRLVGFTLIATLVAAVVLLGYASWLSQRVRRLSRGARRALDDNTPSCRASRPATRSATCRAASRACSSSSATTTSTCARSPRSCRTSCARR